MVLSNDLLSQFAKLTTPEKETSTETTVYGTTIERDGVMFVKLDGSDRLTPVSTTADTKPGERVTVMIKNHTATVTGNMSSPSARTDAVKDLDTKVDTKISEFEIVVAGKVSTKDFDAQTARIDDLVADNVVITGKIEANEASIEDLQAENVTIKGKIEAGEAAIENLQTTKLDSEVADIKYATIENLDATNADINNLEATYADFEKATVEDLTAKQASIEKLQTDKLDVTWANIDFANIDKATLNEIYAQSGLIENVTMEDGTVTGYLVGVTIKGDLIEGNTIVAEKLVIKGEDGLYYKLNTDGVTTEAEQTEHNSLNGQVITAKSITATKISVSDLVAFDATIGGFNITEGAIYSGVKESIDNTTSGLYLGKDGQISLGDETNFLKYYKDEEGNFKLEISAESILFGANSKSSAADLKALTEHVKIGTIIDEETGDEKPCVTLAEGDSDFKQVITNTKTIFLDGSIPKTEVSKDGLKTNNITIDGTWNQSGFVWAGRSNGNYGLSWKGATS